MKLKIEGLSAGYDKDFVIKDLSLSVNQGEFLSLGLRKDHADEGRGRDPSGPGRAHSFGR